MDLSPGLHQPLLCSGKLPTYAFDRIQRERRQGILIQRVEVWTMVRGTNFRKHTDDDSEESGNLWHPVRFTRCSVRGLTVQMSRARGPARAGRGRRLHLNVSSPWCMSPSLTS